MWQATEALRPWSVDKVGDCSSGALARGPRNSDYREQEGRVNLRAAMSSFSPPRDNRETSLRVAIVRRGGRWGSLSEASASESNVQVTPRNEVCQASSTASTKLQRRYSVWPAALRVIRHVYVKRELVSSEFKISMKT